MNEAIDIRVNGQSLRVREGTIVAAAIAQAGVTRFRRSVAGQPRGPLCGMGICFECRLTIDGRAHQRSCILDVAPGMVLQSDE